jgi:hypothetical protein
MECDEKYSRRVWGKRRIEKKKKMLPAAYT